jgi:hypothetical protein
MGRRSGSEKCPCRKCIVAETTEQPGKLNKKNVDEKITQDGENRLYIPKGLWVINWAPCCKTLISSMRDTDADDLHVEGLILATTGCEWLIEPNLALRVR